MDKVLRKDTGGKGTTNTCIIRSDSILSKKKKKPQVAGSFAL